jgi:hypothetical protein
MTGLKDLTEKQYTKYFEVRLKRLRKSGSSYMANCIFHDDAKPSMSVRLDRGIWRCHGCGKGGGILDMEMLITGDKDVQSAVSRIADIIGLPQLKLGAGPEAIYQYSDAQGVALFQVCRFPGKKFLQRKRTEDGNGWDYKTSDIKMVIYNLPEVLQALEVVIVEGEKDADLLMELLETAGMRPRVAATTSPRGAGKWQESFAPYFIGKKVAIIADKDEPGRKHAQRVAESVYPYAYGVKLLEVSTGKDTSDFIREGKTFADLAKELKSASLWTPAVAQSMFCRYQQFEEMTPDTVEWLIEGVAEVGSNGMLIARPKGGKSVSIIDLAVALATGQKWLDFYIPRRRKVGLISREDNPLTTGHRFKKVRLGRAVSTDDLNDWLWINTRQQTKTFLLDNDEEVAQVTADLIKHKVEVVIFDVMRVLHNEDENDNTDMQKVINVLNRIRDATGATIIIVHHSKKGEDEASLTEMARGASAIAGWCEWIAGISVVDKEHWVRSMEIELKGAESPPKFYWKIHDEAVGGSMSVVLRTMPSDYQPPKKAGAFRSAAKKETTPAQREPGDDTNEFNFA